MTTTQNALSRALAAIPDSQINWSPSPTARTPIPQVAQAFWPVSGAVDNSLRDREGGSSVRERAVPLPDQEGAEHEVWLDALMLECLASTIDLPFALGLAPMMVALTFEPEHLRRHAAQDAPMQTICGHGD